VDQAQFLFVFPEGKTASLAKFEQLPPSDRRTFISPDGGYVIFVAQSRDGKESLYLLDSSGAVKPYGEPAENVRALGWLPDSKHFVYKWVNQGQTLSLLGGLGGEPQVEMKLRPYETMRWLDAERFLARQENALYLGDINGGELLIAEGVSDFDFEK
jgi:hypothetical protein